MARYEFTVDAICDGCGCKAPAKLARAEYMQAVPDRGAVQPIRGRAMKVERGVREVLMLPEGWNGVTSKPPPVVTPGDPSVSVFAPAALVAQATGLAQEGYLCPDCSAEAGLVKPEEVPAGVVPS